MKKILKHVGIAAGGVWLAWCVEVEIFEQMSGEGILTEDPIVKDQKFTTGAFGQPKGECKNMYFIDMDGNGTSDKVEVIEEKFPSNLKQGDHIKVGTPFLAGPLNWFMDMKTIEKVR